MHGNQPFILYHMNPSIRAAFLLLTLESNYGLPLAIIDPSSSWMISVQHHFPLKGRIPCMRSQSVYQWIDPKSGYTSE